MNKKVLTFLLSSTLLLLLSAPSIAVIDDYQDAVNAYSRGDYKISYQLMLPLAEKGFAQAQYNLGVMYEKGNGVKQSHKKAKTWFRLAAGQEHAEAVKKLNKLSKKRIKRISPDNSKVVAKNLPIKNTESFQSGLNAFNNKDYKTAHILFSQLAEKGDANAQYTLGLMYGKGHGVPKDNSKAIEWWQLAAEQGNVKAQTNLGWMYEKGKGVSKDTQKAQKWYQLASDQGVSKAQEKLNLLLNKESDTSTTSTKGDAFDGARYMERTPSEIREYLTDSDRFHAALDAFNKTEFGTAYQLFSKLADQGIAEAQVNLGMMFENGQGVSHDYNEAMRWYRLAADQGLTVAQYNLGLMYFDGKGVDKDLIESAKWLKLAADEGLTEAQDKLNVLLKEKSEENPPLNSVDSEDSKSGTSDTVLLMKNLWKTIKDKLTPLNKTHFTNY